MMKKLLSHALNYLLNNWRPLTAFVIKQAVKRFFRENLKPTPTPPSPELKDKFAAAGKAAARKPKKWERSYGKRRTKNMLPPQAAHYILQLYKPVSMRTPNI